MTQLLQKVVIAHPGRQHSHQTALALQEGGMLERYLTSIWYQPDRFPYSFVEWLPGWLKRPVIMELKKRSFQPLDLHRIGTYPVWKTICWITEKLAARWKVTDRHYHMLDRKFDAWVAGKLFDLQHDLFIGYEMASLESFLICKQKSVPCVLDLATVHWTLQRKIFDEESALGFPIVEIEPSLLKEIERVKEQELLLADYVLAPSNHVVKSLIHAGINEQKILQIPYGVDVSLFKPKPKYKKNGCFTVLYTGSITGGKGIRYLLEVFKQLKLLNAELVLIGGMANGGKILSRYKEVFKYIPFLHHDDLVHYYQNADILVLPSLIEGFSQVVLEAMACGTPVIVSDHSGSNDAVRDGMDGFVVPIRELGALRERISYLYEHRQKLEEMGLNARKQAEKYSWEIYRERVRQMVTKISSGRKDKVALCSPA